MSAESTPDHPLRVWMIFSPKPAKHGARFLDRQAESLEDAGVCVHRFELRTRKNPLLLLLEAWRCRRLLRAVSPDVIHVQYGAMNALFAILLPRRIPKIVTFRGSDLNPHPDPRLMMRLHHGIGRFLSHVSVPFLRGAILVSEELRGRFRIRPPVCRVIPNGVDQTRFHPEETAHARARLGWGLEERVVCFYEGGERIGKGTALAQDVLAQVEKALGAVRFVVFDGSIAAAEMPTYLNAADCLLFTSLTEGSPNIVKEAMACNLPVVSVPVGDVPERLRGVEPSVVVPRDAAALAAAVCAILQRRTRSNGAGIVSRDLALAVIARRIVAVYREVLNDPPARDR